MAIFWMTAKRDGNCNECNEDIAAGDRMVWDSELNIAYCADSMCGVAAAGEDPNVTEKNKREALKHAQSRSKRKK